MDGRLASGAAVVNWIQAVSCSLYLVEYLNCIWLNIFIVFGWISSSYLVDVLRCTFLAIFIAFGFWMSPFPLSKVFNHAITSICPSLKSSGLEFIKTYGSCKDECPMNCSLISCRRFYLRHPPTHLKTSGALFRRIWFLGKGCKKKMTTIEECQFKQSV